MFLLTGIISVAILVPLAFCQPLVSQDFTPIVTATCKAGYMTIKVQTNGSFIGALHAKDYRTPSCLTYGNGTSTSYLVVNLFTPVSSSEYCGVLVSNKTDERSVPVAVRIHKTLELADDKFYIITCGKAGFKNARNETSMVSLRLMDPGKTHRLQEVFYSHPYVIRAEISKPDGTHSVRVKNCFAFNRRNISAQLIDERGCPRNKNVMSPFVYDETKGTADSTLYSMFQFPDGNQVHIQCDIGVCKGICPELNCDDDLNSGTPIEEGVVVASTSVFVLQPGDAAALKEIAEASIWSGTWPLYLAIVLGVLFLLMLILNVFLCSAMSCSCSRSQIIEKEPSIIEDYDPYRSWHGTHYSSRYSLNGKGGGDYRSGGSTLNSARSVSSISDHYAIVENSRHRDRQHPSHMSYPKH